MNYFAFAALWSDYFMEQVLNYSSICKLFNLIYCSSLLILSLINYMLIINEQKAAVSRDRPKPRSGDGAKINNISVLRSDYHHYISLGNKRHWCSNHIIYHHSSFDFVHPFRNTHSNVVIWVHGIKYNTTE